MSQFVNRRLALACLVAATAGMSGCTPAELAALLGPSVSTQKPAGGAAVAESTSKQPVKTGIIKPGAGGEAASEADPAKDALLAKFKAKVDGAGSAPEQTAKLFVAAFAQYDKDAALAKAMMTLVADDGELTQDPGSRSGFRFIAAREIYWATVDRNPSLGRSYLRAKADADGANPEESVAIDYTYDAVDKGVNGARAKFYIPFQDGTAKRPRPISLIQTNGRWKVTEFSSIVVPI
jgi:hypothetical protein